MLTSKRQEWILQLIKGPDITPVESSPGRYTSNRTVSVVADERHVTIRPTDVLDLSNPELLIIQSGDRERTISWERISSLEFDEQDLSFTPKKTQVRNASQRMLHFPLRKKVV